MRRPGAARRLGHGGGGRGSSRFSEALRRARVEEPALLESATWRGFYGKHSIR